MPEGPSILILRELLEPFKGKQVINASGDADIDLDRLNDHIISDIRSYGKNIFLCFTGFYIRVHLMMYGTYKINGRKEGTPRLRITTNKEEINFYTCIVTLLEGKSADQYDWDTDVLSDEWNPLKAEKTLKAMKKEKVSDVLLDQNVFTGVGNIIKNEVLFRVKIHPESLVSALPTKKLKELVKVVRQFSFDFYNWKNKNQLNKNLNIYSKKKCQRCGIPNHTAYIGKGKRLPCFCANCQVMYASEALTK
ncbi:MAG: endonuclease [Cytophagaceae bacterium]|nr:endonuclease [Cytophagaceae bacterium]